MPAIDDVWRVAGRGRRTHRTPHRAHDRPMAVSIGGLASLTAARFALPERATRRALRMRFRARFGVAGGVRRESLWRMGAVRFRGTGICGVVTLDAEPGDRSLPHRLMEFALMSGEFVDDVMPGAYGIEFDSGSGSRIGTAAKGSASSIRQLKYQSPIARLAR